MDPIKSLISSSDPLRHDAAAEPDADAALRSVLKGAPMFSDSLPSNLLRFEDRKRRRARLAGVLTLTAAAVTAGLLVATNLGALTSAPAPAPANTATDTASPASSASAAPASSPTPTATPTPTPAVTPTQAPAPPAAAAVAWTTFTDSSGQAHFQHPPTWQVTETIETTVSDLGYWNRTIRVTDAGGKLLSSLHIAPDAAGGSCTPVPYQTLDAVTLDIPQTPTSSPHAGPTQYKYRVMEGAEVFGALTIDSSSVAPAGTACLLVSAIQPPQNVPAVSFGMGAFLDTESKGGGEGAAAQKSFASVAEARPTWTPLSTGT